MSLGGFRLFVAWPEWLLAGLLLALLAAWMERRWRTKDAVVADVVEGCRALAARRDLTLSFRRQRGHTSTHAGRNDYAAYNARADALATEAALRS